MKSLAFDIIKMCGCFRYLGIALVMMVAGGVLHSCSTTKKLPDGELLYVGIDDVKYVDNVLEQERGEHLSDAATATHSQDSVDVDKVKNTKTKLKDVQEQRKNEMEEAKSEVEAVLNFAPNNALFGSSYHRFPLPIGLWSYNAFVDSKGKLGKWMHKTFSADPIYISTVSPDMRVKVATNTLRNYGYFRGDVNYEIVPQRNPKKAKLKYNVTVGPLWKLDSVEYRGFSPAKDSLLRIHAKESLLKKGDAFNVVKLSNEQSRIENLFRENGYYYYSADMVTYTADTLCNPGYVWLRVQPDEGTSHLARHPWYIGRTYVSVRSNSAEVPDSILSLRNYTYNFSGKKMPLRAGIWRRAINHRKGEMYRLSRQQSTIEKLGALGVLSQMDLGYVPRDTTADCDTLDVYITAVMDKLYDASFETNVMFKSNQQVGPGVSFGLAKRNAFRGAERVSFDIYGSYEWQTGMGSEGSKSLLNSYELGTQLAIELPRFAFPWVNRRRLRFPATTTFAVTGSWQKRSQFFNRVSMGAGVTYNWQKRPTIKHEMTLLSLDFDKMISRAASFDSIMTANPALSLSMRDQFIPSFSYTMTYTSAAHHRNPVWLQLNVKEAGNLTSSIYAICGQKFNRPDKNLFGNPFAQYLKFSAEVHETYRIPRTQLKLAGRLFVGAIYSYGNSRYAPYSDLFYVGGANSVRGFTVRTIGPGGYKSADAKYAYVDQTGDFKLEANLEFRFPIVSDLHGAAFLDAGNVWLLRKDELRPGAELNLKNLKKIAVGTGVGLRYDLDFLVLRFDVGVGLHAPHDTGKDGWYNMPKFGRSLAYHLAIGYPF